MYTYTNKHINIIHALFTYLLFKALELIALLTSIKNEETISEKSKDCTTLPIYKQKGDIMNCENYCGIIS